MLLVWIALGFVLVALALLAVPVEVVFSAEHHHGHGKASGMVYWLFGLVRIPLGGNTRKTRLAPARPRVRSTHRHPRGAGRLIAVLHVEGLARRVFALLQDLLLRIRIRELSIDGHLGLDDPADTGRMWAFVGPLAVAVALLPMSHIAIEPTFASEGFDVRARSRIRLIPGVVLFVLARFLLSPGTVRALRAMRVAGP